VARVLIVEDYPSLQTVYKFALEKAGHKVDICEDGETALALASHHAYDIVVLDLLLQKVHGLDFLRALNAPQKFPHLKIIVMSNIKHPRVFEDALELGVARYYVKSSTKPSDLVQAVTELEGSGRKKRRGKL
jgi:CheY-like chemotaxis protein